jgi:hypothetical protein
MKNLIRIVVLSGLVVTYLLACNKQGSGSSAGKPALTLSKSTVARGEQLVITAQPSSAATIVRFSVFPAAATKLFSSRDQANAFFGNSGSYTVTANYYTDSAGAPFDSSSSPVTVSDSIYSPPTPIQSDTSALAGDAIQIEPITATDTGGLIMVAQTTKLYGCNPTLNYYFEQFANTINIYFLDVDADGVDDCGGVKSTAKGFIFAKAPANGTYNFNVILNTATYQGTLTVTDQNYTFGWSYTSAVTISPLQIATK